MEKRKDQIAEADGSIFSAGNELQLILDHLIVPFAFLDNEKGKPDSTDFLCFSYINNAGAEYTGLSSEEITGRSFNDIFPVKENPLLANACTEVLEKRNVKKLENIPCVIRRGKERIITAADFIIYFSSGRIALSWNRLQASDNRAIDKESETAYHRNQDNFRILADNMSQLAWMADENGWIFWYNKRWFEYTGTVQEEMLGWEWKRVHHPDYVDNVVKKFSDAISAGIPWEDTFPLKRKDGNYRWFLSRAMPVKDENNKVILWFGTNTDVTEQKKYEEKLKESEEKLRLFVEGLPLFAWSADAEGNVDFFSGRWQEFSRNLADEGRGWNWEPAVHPDDLQMTLNIWKHSISTGEEYNIIHRLKKNDGQYCWRLTHSTPIRDDSGSIIRWYGTSIDIDKQKVLEEKVNLTLEELKKNEADLAFAQELAHVGSYQVNYINNTLECSKELLRIFELDEENRLLNPADFMKLVHPDDLSKLQTTIEKADKNNAACEFEYRAILKSGKIKYLQTRRVPVFDGHGNTISHFAVTLDITEIKSYQLLVEKSQFDLKEAQKLAHIGSFTMDLEGEGSVEWSEEMFRIFERDTAAGTPTLKEIYDCILPEDQPRAAAVIKNMIEIKSRMECDLKVKTFMGNIKHLHSVLSPVIDISGRINIVFGTAHDITERMLQQEKIQETMLQLERSNKELEQFAYVASHDLQEPLRMVNSFGRLLSRQYRDKLDQKAIDYIEFMVDGAQRMQSLISDLLLYARVTTKAQPLVPTDINHIMELVVTDLKMSIDEKKAFIQYDALPVIHADPIQIRQLFQNLISNAIKFKAEDYPEVIISAEKRQNDWLFCIKDNGIGIDPEFHERVFVIFQRLHEREKYSGTGIGLALCKKIVERHGGKIWVESESGNGCSFYFTIPC